MIWTSEAYPPLPAGARLVAPTQAGTGPIAVLCDFAAGAFRSSRSCPRTAGVSLTADPPTAGGIGIAHPLVYSTDKDGNV